MNRRQEDRHPLPSNFLQKWRESHLNLAKYKQILKNPEYIGLLLRRHVEEAWPLDGIIQRSGLIGGGGTMIKSEPSIAQRSTVGSGNGKSKQKTLTGRSKQGDEMWVVDMQIRSTVEINLMPRRSPVNCRASSVSDSRWMARPRSDGGCQHRAASTSER